MPQSPPRFLKLLGRVSQGEPLFKNTLKLLPKPNPNAVPYWNFLINEVLDYVIMQIVQMIYFIYNSTKIKKKQKPPPTKNTTTTKKKPKTNTNKNKHTEWLNKNNSDLSKNTHNGKTSRGCTNISLTSELENGDFYGRLCVIYKALLLFHRIPIDFLTFIFLSVSIYNGNFQRCLAMNMQEIYKWISHFCSSGKHLRCCEK